MSVVFSSAIALSALAIKQFGVNLKFRTVMVNGSSPDRSTALASVQLETAGRLGEGLGTGEAVAGDPVLGDPPDLEATSDSQDTLPTMISASTARIARRNRSPSRVEGFTASLGLSSRSAVVLWSVEPSP